MWNPHHTNKKEKNNIPSLHPPVDHPHPFLVPLNSLSSPTTLIPSHWLDDTSSGEQQGGDDVRRLALEATTIGDLQQGEGSSNR